MNTIEQAQEVAERLRNHDTCISDKKAANTIDALIAELNDERMRCTQADHAVEQMAAELAALKNQQPVGEAVKNYGCGGSTFVRFSRELGIGEFQSAPAIADGRCIGSQGQRPAPVGVSIRARHC